jgi:prepilin-type N-terminal cleavage/methylation domain-containing protein
MVGRRGLSMIELLMALAITGMVAAAISSMWSAISAGERSLRDNRAFTVRTYTAKNRITAYVARSRCVLFVDPMMLVLWLEDSRESGTVHASELRWFIVDQTRGLLDVYFVKFPGGYDEVHKALRDEEYAGDADWETALGVYLSAGEVAKITLVDGLVGGTFHIDTPDALDAREVTVDLDFSTESPDQVVSQSVTAAILAHAVPSNP